MWERNLLPRPWPSLAPFTIPAMSTSLSAAGMTFCGGMNCVIRCRRPSGTLTIPSLGSIVQKG